VGLLVALIGGVFHAASRRVRPLRRDVA